MSAPRGPLAVAAGIHAGVTGLARALAQRAARRVYLRAAVVSALATVVLQGALFAAAAALLPAPGDPGSPLGWVAVVLAWIVVGAAILLVAPVVVLLLLAVLLPLWSERIFFASLSAEAPALAANLRACPQAPLSRALRRTAARFTLWLAALAAGAVVGLLPVAGPLLGAAVGLGATAWVLAWELLDPLLDRVTDTPAAERRFLRGHAGVVWGLGLAWSALVAIPLVGPLAFPLVQAAAAAVVPDLFGAAIAPLPTRDPVE